MIAAVLAIIYITFVCWSYGSIFLHLLAKLGRSAMMLSTEIVITCFTGMAVIGVLFTALSIFMPLGNGWVQAIVFIPGLLWAFWKKPVINLAYKTSRQKLAGFPSPLLAILLSGVLLVLVMQSRVINHPDTLNYHAQHIGWVENYKAIPGIVHLNVNLGTQSSWFILCALFSFNFTGTTALSFINTAVLCWFLVFITARLNEAWKNENKMSGLLWLMLLIFSYWSYTQVRLTATSASPDFIAALYTWLVIYLFIKDKFENNKIFYALLVFLGFFAMTIKLSALFCVFPCIYAWYRYAKVRTAAAIFFPVTAGAFVLIPYFIKNVINTGYLVFPSPIPDLFTVDWKLKHDSLVLFQHYVSSYAKTHVEYDAEKIMAIAKMNVTGWLPVWWKLRSIPDKLILLSIPFSLFISLFSPGKIYNSSNRRLITALIFCAAGILFWFVQAPDPRFGFGFLIPFTGILLYLLLDKSKILQRLANRWLRFSLMLVSIAVLSYTAYRLVYFFRPADFIQPAGVSRISTQAKDCQGIAVNIPVPSFECGTTPVPCSNDPCESFIPRGTEVEAGFRER